MAGYAAGLTWLGMAATAAALVAASLNAAFGFCLGCEMYLLLRRVWPVRPGLVPAHQAPRGQGQRSGSGT